MGTLGESRGVNQYGVSQHGLIWNYILIFFSQFCKDSKQHSMQQFYYFTNYRDPFIIKGRRSSQEVLSGSYMESPTYTVSVTFERNYTLTKWDIFQEDRQKGSIVMKTDTRWKIWKIQSV